MGDLGSDGIFRMEGLRSRDDLVTMSVPEAMKLRQHLLGLVDLIERTVMPGKPTTKEIRDAWKTINRE